MRNLCLVSTKAVQYSELTISHPHGSDTFLALFNIKHRWDELEEMPRLKGRCTSVMKNPQDLRDHTTDYMPCDWRQTKVPESYRMTYWTGCKEKGLHLSSLHTWVGLVFAPLSMSLDFLFWRWYSITILRYTKKTRRVKYNAAILLGKQLLTNKFLTVKSNLVWNSCAQNSEIDPKFIFSWERRMTDGPHQDVTARLFPFVNSWFRLQRPVYTMQWCKPNPSELDLIQPDKELIHRVYC